MTTDIDLALSVGDSAEIDFSNFLDAEKLLRLHPHWHVLETARDGDVIIAKLKDHATDEHFELQFKVSFPGSHRLMVECLNGAVEHFHFYAREGHMHVAFAPRNASLTSEEENNLTLWLQSIRQYLRLYLKTTPYTLFFRWLMDRALLKMNPSQRKICLMLYRFTLLEIVVILIIVVGYFAIGRS